MNSVLILCRLRGFLAVFDLAQIINLVWTSFKTQYVAITKQELCNTYIASVLGRTPRDIREWTQPPDFQYSVY